MITAQEIALSPFENALIHENPETYPKSRIAGAIAVLTVLLFSLLYAPLAQTAEISLEPTILLAVLNQDRIKYGLAPLEPNPKLEAAAQAKARDILERGYFAHTSPGGLAPWDFITAAGFGYSFAGENLALNYQGAFDLENDFMDSPSHRENLLSPLFSEVGIAVEEGIYQGESAIITVQMFGSPAD